MYLPTDTKTITFHAFGGGTYKILDIPDGQTWTILGITSIADGGGSPNEKIKIGTKEIHVNYSADKATNINPYIPLNELVSGTDDLILAHTANNKSFDVLVNYVERNRQLNNDPATPIQITGDTLDPKLLSTTLMTDGNKFQVQRIYSFGDLTIILLLIPIALMIAYKMILAAFRKPLKYYK